MLKNTHTKFYYFFFFQFLCAENRQNEPRISTSMESLILTGPGDFHRAFSNRMKNPFGFYRSDRIPFALTLFQWFANRLRVTYGNFDWIMEVLSKLYFVLVMETTVQCNCYSTCVDVRVQALSHTERYIYTYLYLSICVYTCVLAIMFSSSDVCNKLDRI